MKLRNQKQLQFTNTIDIQLKKHKSTIKKKEFVISNLPELVEKLFDSQIFNISYGLYGIKQLTQQDYNLFIIEYISQETLIPYLLHLMQNEMPESIIIEATKLLNILSLHVKKGIIENGGIQICMQLLRKNKQIEVIVQGIKLLIRLISLDNDTPLELKNQAILTILEFFQLNELLLGDYFNESIYEFAIECHKRLHFFPERVKQKITQYFIELFLKNKNYRNIELTQMCLSLICSPVVLDVKLTRFLYLTQKAINSKLLSIAYFTVFPGTDEIDFYEYLRAILQKDETSDQAQFLIKLIQFALLSPFHWKLTNANRLIEGKIAQIFMNSIQNNKICKFY